MIHISKTQKRKFQVTNVAKNGEALKPSESFESKQNCWKNIRSELETCYSADSHAIVQDNTLRNPKVFLVGPKKMIEAKGIKLQKPYIPS